MVFNSLNYLIFLFIALLFFHSIPLGKRWMVLLLASICFYLSFVPVFLLLILVLATINFFFGIYLEESKRKEKKSKIGFFVFINVSILAVFKYFNFFVPVTDFSVVNWRIFETIPSINHWIIPIGLSYISFTLISYLIEVNRGRVPAERHPGIFGIYVLFFPKIAQGPIERPYNLLPQLKFMKNVEYNEFIEGLKLIIWGFFKKLVVADRLSLYVDAVYNNSEAHNGVSLALATIFYAFQIYADFSGYTDIALGTAKLFGISLTNNFNRPYFSVSIKDFWSRWHISFSTWLRDYLFLPLAFYFSKHLKRQRYLFLSTEKWIYVMTTMIVFAICGIWHGEGMNYLVWGLLFGVLLSFANWTEKLNRKIRKVLHIRKDSVLYKFYNVPITFLLVSFTWIFFRSSSLDVAVNIIGKIFMDHGSIFIGEPDIFFYSVVAILLLVVLEFKFEYFKNSFKFFENRNVYVRMVSYCILIIMIGLFGVFDGGQFIYFQF